MDVLLSQQRYPIHCKRQKRLVSKIQCVHSRDTAFAKVMPANFMIKAMLISALVVSKWYRDNKLYLFSILDPMIYHFSTSFAFGFQRPFFLTDFLERPGRHQDFRRSHLSDLRPTYPRVRGKGTFPRMRTFPYKETRY